MIGYYITIFTVQSFRGLGLGYIGGMSLDIRINLSRPVRFKGELRSIYIIARLV